jgi:hypothetical protein
MVAFFGRPFLLGERALTPRLKVRNVLAAGHWPTKKILTQIGLKETLNYDPPQLIS